MKNDIAEKIMRVIDASGNLQPGSVTHVLVEHEKGCPSIRTQKLTDCICNPDIRRMGTC
jgi:hypothetical protein